jgi:DnaJ-class molecular chaperone
MSRELPGYDLWLTTDPRENDPDPEPCLECDGEGRITDEDGDASECHVCHGTGDAPYPDPADTYAGPDDDDRETR